MKYSSSLLLIAEVLSRSLRQPSNDISRKEASTLISLLGPLSRRVFDQFARVSAKTVSDRREIIVESMRLSQEGIKRRFRELPILGEDIFAGQFESMLQSEAKRKKDLQKANLSNPRFTSRRSPVRRPFRSGKDTRGKRQPSFQGSSRSSIQPNRSRQPALTFQSRPRTRGSSRGATSSRGRSFSKP
ncbi:hypothetical protein HOLleu_13954 [Holothuria leucospilota]|uniref:Uncharacterized protein n=1 Tax=Holothuria leucospilota TaxID=206669 RepID=A0A9Q1C7Y4_HOLLE|nr:hypothetical protein HOLleu_13954 [Holothuria leucospilota]